jgi:hypothetical protein
MVAVVWIGDLTNPALKARTDKIKERENNLEYSPRKRVTTA